MRYAKVRIVRGRTSQPVRVLSVRAHQRPRWVLANTVCAYASGMLEGNTTAFDDILNAWVPNLLCSTRSRFANEKRFLVQMMKEYALEYSNEGDMAAPQRHRYIGTIFDALRGRLPIGKAGFDKTTALLTERMQQALAARCFDWSMGRRPLRTLS